MSENHPSEDPGSHGPPPAGGSPYPPDPGPSGFPAYSTRPSGRYGPPGPPGPPAPPPGSGLPTWAAILLGALIGGCVSVFAPVLAIMLYDTGLSDWLQVALVTVIPALLAVPLLFFRVTRPWGIGAIIGLAVGSFVLGGACVGILSGLEGG